MIDGMETNRTIKEIFLHEDIQKAAMQKHAVIANFLFAFSNAPKDKSTQYLFLKFLE